MPEAIRSRLGRKVRVRRPLNPEIPDGALDLPVAEEQLAGSEVASTLVDEGDLRAPQAVSAVGARLEINCSGPLPD